MRTEILDDGTILLVVSDRNIRSLFAKLNGSPSDSECTIVGSTLYPRTVLKAEPDDVHYNHPSRLGLAPGFMHPQTEDNLKEADAILEQDPAA